MTKKLRCAIYTRKSSQEGLDQDFNSLHAQREACAAFVASQASLGWKSIDAVYDDGGFSGGSMERPGLKTLLADINRGWVDVVVVYKIDRLTRSLMDFARIVDLFDTHGVSFVSVTQQFNTTTSMGRLTLNVLLSFAQFEREVTAERIRDKIAASKKKGIWMGGLPPLGYDVVDRSLIVNESEAETVLKIFRLYLELGSVRRLKDTADRLDLVTKRRTNRQGLQTGGKPFQRGHLYKLLSNPTYIGQIRHKDKFFPGQHEGIIDLDVWQQVQVKLNENAPTRQAGGNHRHTSLLTGLLFDETGDRLSPSHTVKRSKANREGSPSSRVRYRYYVSHRCKNTLSDKKDGWRLPADHLERVILSAIATLLNDKTRLIKLAGLDRIDAATTRKVLSWAGELASQLPVADKLETRRIVRSLIVRIDLSPQNIRVTLNRNHMQERIGVPATDNPTACSFDVPFTLRRRGVEARLVVGGIASKTENFDPRLVETIGQAHRWLHQLTSGPFQSVQELGQAEQIEGAEISRVLPLAFLSPRLVEAIFAGHQPEHLTVGLLKRFKPMPNLWSDQRHALGFID